ncbi:MAG: DEAD/DEAH box helicase family protein, partial [Nanoarchaeota archaeon]|nr:DEAD/DEAH box helicase family protein [Nanoarchaeota archaeon]
MYEDLCFRGEFRKYQRLILSVVENEIKKSESKFHIVAPPGSGKTIVGIELIRKLGVPAVVFAPTTTIQLQWKEKFSMFMDTGKADSLVSLSPKEITP